MKKVLIIFTLLAINFIHAATVTLNQTVYTPTDGLSIIAEFKGMTGQNKDWIAIYPVGSNNSWKNVIAWKWTGDKTSGKLTLIDVNQRLKIKTGKYEVRAFYNNSYKLETKVAFEIKGENPQKVELKLPKTKYNINETISVKFKNMINKNKDWIAIYPAASNNAWANVIDWAWTDDKSSGELTFDSLPEGNYEIRAFYNNSAAVVYAKTAFKVEDVGNNSESHMKMLFKNGYLSLFFNYARKPITGGAEKPQDWVGIYKKGDSVSWANVIQWKWLKDIRVNEELVHISGAGNNDNHLDALVTHRFSTQKLPAGDYEARFFRNNSFKLDTSLEFTIK